MTRSAIRPLVSLCTLGPFVAAAVLFTTLALPRGIAWARERRAEARRAVAVQAASEPFVAKQASVVVQAGDTLWDLCQRYTGKPWVWPQVWALNPQLTNPHWLETGSIIYFEGAAKAAVGASQVSVAHAMDAGQGDDGTAPVRGGAPDSRAAISASGSNADSNSSSASGSTSSANATSPEAEMDAGVTAAGALATAQAATSQALAQASGKVTAAPAAPASGGTKTGTGSFAAPGPTLIDATAPGTGPTPAAHAAQGPNYVPTEGSLEASNDARAKASIAAKARAAASVTPSLRSALWPSAAVRSLPRIAALLGERPMALRGERIVVEAPSGRMPLHAGELYVVVAVEDAVKGLGRAEGGQMLSVRGVVRILGDGVRAEAELLHISAEVEAGLLLAPLAHFQADMKMSSGPGPAQFTGQVLAVEGAALVTGGRKLVFLGAGSRDGLEPGMHLWLVEQAPHAQASGAAKRAGTSEITTGELKIVQVQPGHSTCAILHATHEVSRGQWVVATPPSQ